MLRAKSKHLSAGALIFVCKTIFVFNLSQCRPAGASDQSLTAYPALTGWATVMTRLRRCLTLSPSVFINLGKKTPTIQNKAALVRLANCQLLFANCFDQCHPC